MKRLFILILGLMLSFGVLTSCSGEVEGLAGQAAPAGQQGLQLPDDILPVFVLAGQSNMSGRGQDKILDPYKDRQEQIYYIVDTDRIEHTGKKQLTKSLSPHNGTDGNGPELSFAYHIQKKLNRPIGIIRKARGGTSLLGPWNPEGIGGDLYNRLKILVDAVKKNWKDNPPIAEITKIEVVGMVWLQGESDMKGSREVAYARTLAKLIDNYNTHFLNDQTYFKILPFVATKVYNGKSHYGKTPETTVQEAIKSYSGTHSKYYTWVDRASYHDLLPHSANQSDSYDYVHINNKGAADLGRKYYNAMMRLLKVNKKYVGKVQYERSPDGQPILVPDTNPDNINF